MASKSSPDLNTQINCIQPKMAAKAADSRTRRWCGRGKVFLESPYVLIVLRMLPERSELPKLFNAKIDKTSPPLLINISLDNRKTSHARSLLPKYFRMSRHHRIYGKLMRKVYNAPIPSRLPDFKISIILRVFAIISSVPPKYPEHTSHISIILNFFFPISWNYDVCQT